VDSLVYEPHCNLQDALVADAGKKRLGDGRHVCYTMTHERKNQNTPYKMTHPIMNQTSFPKDLHAAAIYMAQVYGDAEMEKMLWRATDDVNAKVDYGGCSLMHLAATKGYAPLLKLLHQAKASLDIKDNVSWTPMMWAARSGHLSCVQFLVEQGAKIEYTYNNSNCSSLMIAAINGYAAIVNYLLNTDANVDTVDLIGRTSLIQISGDLKYQATVMRLLLDHGANINAQNHSGHTALITATLVKNTDAVKLLLENGANTMIRDNNNQTALDIASHYNFDEIANLIRHHDEQNAISNCPCMECAP
jgi:ankyrin repeat protein